MKIIRSPLADDIKDFEVLGKNKELLGRVSTVVYEKHTMSALYALLDFSSFLGIASKLYPTPIVAMEIDFDKRCVYIDHSKASLMNAKSINNETIDELSNYETAQSIYRFYDVYEMQPQAVNG